MQNTKSVSSMSSPKPVNLQHAHRKNRHGHFPSSSSAGGLRRFASRFPVKSSVRQKRVRYIKEQLLC